eukprot:scaffold14630_cov45-Phaeocystis_antarctica.AAC.1
MDDPCLASWRPHPTLRDKRSHNSGVQPGSASSFLVSCSIARVAASAFRDAALNCSTSSFLCSRRFSAFKACARAMSAACSAAAPRLTKGSHSWHEIEPELPSSRARHSACSLGSGSFSLLT